VDFNRSLTDLSVPLVDRLRPRQHQKLTSCLVHVLRSYDEYKRSNADVTVLLAHLKLFRFTAKLVLRKLPSGPHSRDGLFSRFLNNEFASLLHDMVSASDTSSVSSSRPAIDHRVQRLIRQFRLSAAAEALQETPVQKPTAAAAAELCQKFPARKVPYPQSQPSPTPFPSLTIDQLRAVASRMNQHAASGPSGMPVWMLTHPLITSNPSTTDQEFAQLLARYFDDIANGLKITKSGLCHGSLLALVKPDTSLRPVVMPEVDHRFIGRVLLNVHIDQIREFFGGLQLSHARSGTEKVAHYVNSFFRTHNDSFLIQLDLANAFNEISRTRIRNALVQHFPMLVRFFDLMHADNYSVHFGDYNIECTEGVLQGDTLGSTYFSLGIHSILHELQLEFPDFILKYYSDDGNILGRRSTLQNASRITDFLSTAAQKFNDAGLRIRLDKSTIYSPHFDIDASLFSPQLLDSCPLFGVDARIRLVPAVEGVVVLGTPIGSADFVVHHSIQCASRIASQMRKLDKIRGLKQEYIILLRQCFNPRFHHLCRTVDPMLLDSAARLHDNNVNIRLQRVVPDLPLVQINDSWNQWALPYCRARLPLRLGGLGIIAAAHLSHSAYLASLGTSWSSLGTLSSSFLDCARSSLLHLVDSTASVSSQDPRFPTDLAVEHATLRSKTLWKLCTGNAQAPVDAAAYLETHTQDIMPRLSVKHVQHSLTLVEASKFYDFTIREVFTFYEPRLASYYLARFLSSSCRESVLWSAVIPTEPIFTISPLKYGYLLAYQLGSRIPSSQHWRSNCDCGASLVQDPLHVFSCERRYPHDRVKVQLAHFCKAAGLLPTIEPLNTCHGPCQPDLAVPDLLSSGQTLLVDFTTADAGAVSHLNRGSAKTYHVAWKHVEACKTQKYSGNFDAAQYSFLPVAMESSGRWSGGLYRFFSQVKSFARLNRTQDAVRHSAFVARWRKVLCVVFRVSQIICLESLVSSLVSDGSQAIAVDDY